MPFLGNKAAGYLRLSREDGDKIESDSIKNQRELIREYIAKHENLTYVGDYIDDGFSGTTYERPSFQRLLGCMFNQQRSLTRILANGVTRKKGNVSAEK